MLLVLPLARWLVENGIGEDRAIVLDRGEIVAARIDWPGPLAPGQIEDAVLVAKAKGSARGTVRFADRQEALIDKLPASASQGAPLRVEITRAAWSESGRRKLAQARPSTSPATPPLTLADRLRAQGHMVETVGRFPDGDWDELWLEAWHGSVAFTSGALSFFETPAMVLVDIDGTGSARQLALDAVAPLAMAMERFDLNGSIGIDFPTLQAKADRKSVDSALNAALAHWPHERTSMNGFGFVQIVARKDHPSLLNRTAHAKPGAAARLLLRKAESITDPGALLLSCHPAVEAKLTQEWRDELARRSGRMVRVVANPALALEAGFAQAVPL